MGNLILIASYPKSGNTWTRLVMQGLLDPGRAGAINGCEIGLYGSNRRRAFDEFAPALAADLLPHEIDAFLPSVYEQIASESRGAVFLKVHDRAYRNLAGEWIFPPSAVAAVLHLVRHPFDVAVSFAKHTGLPVARTVEVMADRNYGLASERNELAPPMREVLGSWSDHAASWLDPALPYRVVTARYEDLYQDDLGSFRRLARAAGFSSSVIDERLDSAVRSARFEQVQALEQARGFREKPDAAIPFFDAGRPMRWTGILSEALRLKLLADHSATMGQLGYLDTGNTRDRLDFALTRC